MSPTTPIFDMAAERIAVQGPPARICRIGLGDRHRAGLMFNEMVASGELKAPIVIGRGHLDSGSVARPTAGRRRCGVGSDAALDWPLLNARPNTASGATWVSLHRGGGMGFSRHSGPELWPRTLAQNSGIVVVADGSQDAARRLSNALWNGPATGVAPRRCGP